MRRSGIGGGAVARAFVWLGLGWQILGCAPRHPRGTSAVESAASPVEIVLGAPASGGVVYLEAVVSAGSARDAIGEEGLAALTAHSMVAGGAGGRSPQQIRDVLYPTGSGFQVIVDREWVSIRLKCHVDHASLCVELFADVLSSPGFDDAEVMRLRDEATYWVTRGVLADEEALGMEVFDNWLFEGHPYGHPVDGRAGVLPLLDAERTKAFFRSHYVRESMWVGLAGEYDEPLVAELASRLESVSGERAPELVLQQPVPVVGRSLLAVGTGTPVAGFHFGHPLELTRSDPDFPAMYLAATAMGAHRQSFGRLFQRLRGARGLNYGDYAYVEPFAQRGWSSLPEQGVVRRQPYFYVWLRPTSIENGPFALKLALIEVERWLADGLTEEEFESTRSYLLGYAAMIAQNPGRRLSYKLESMASGTPSLLDLLDGLGALTAEEVNDAVRQRIHPGNLRIVVVTGEPEEVVARLLGAEPTPIVYTDVEPDEAQAAEDQQAADYDVQLGESRVIDAEGIFR